MLFYLCWVGVILCLSNDDNVFGAFDLQARGHSCPYLCKESLIVEGVGAAAMKSTRKVGVKK